MRILITNDDGINAEGIALLTHAAKVLSDDVWVVAPVDNQSSCSRKITQSQKVACHRLAPRRFAVEGTPGDCAIIGLNGLLEDQRPALVLSGVNRGSNLGEDVDLSGTVGACLQAWEQGVPAIALSQVLHNFHAEQVNWIAAQAHLESTLKRLVPWLLDNPTVINVNFPPLDKASDVKAMVVAPTGRRPQPLNVIKETDGNGHYRFDYRTLRNQARPQDNSDIDLAYLGHITLTPLTLNRSDQATAHLYAQLINLL